jgi:hypothetical protein
VTVDYPHTDSPAIADADLPNQADVGLLSALVHVMAPRLFAIVAEPSDGDIHVVAWGLRFDDYVALIGTDGQIAGSFSSVGRALWLFSYLDATLRVIWHPQPASTRPRHPHRRIIRRRT